MKFNRNYRITIQKKPNINEFIEILPPFTIHFDIVRNTSSSLNKMSLQIYNLSWKYIEKIYRDPYEKVGESYRNITLEIGYNDKLSLVFSGSLLSAQPKRQGNDVILDIVANDGAISSYNSYFSKAYPAGIPALTIVKDLMNALTKDTELKIGVIGEVKGTSPRPQTFNGNTWSILQERHPNRVYIDNEIIHFMNKDETVGVPILSIDSNNGLLGTPQRTHGSLTVDILLEPHVIVGQIISLSSQVNPLFDGTYKVIGIKHSGTISEAESGQAKTTLDFLYGIGNLKDLNRF